MKKVKALFSRFDTIFSRLILAFTVIVVVVVTIADCILLSQFSAKYNEKVEKLELNRIRSMETELYSLFCDANRIMIEIATMQSKDEDVQRVFDRKVYNDYYKIEKVFEYLKTIANQNVDCVDSIEFFSLKNNLMISTSSGISYVNLEEDTIDSYGILQKEIVFQGKRRWLSGRTIEKERSEYNVYSFVSGYPLYTQKTDKFKGYIVINFSKEKIDSLLEDNLLGDYDSIAVIDPDGKVVLSTGNQEILTDFVENSSDYLCELPYTEQNEVIIENNRETLYSQKIGDENWAIVKLVSKREFYKETRTIQLVCIAFSILTIVVGILLSYIFARRIYQPFYLIMNKLAQAKLSKSARENEYYYIDRAIDELSMRAVVKENALNQNIHSIKHDFAAQILFGKTEAINEISHKLQLMDYKEIYPYNYVLLVKLHRKIYESLEKDKMDLVNQGILTFFDSYTKDSIYCIPTDLFNGTISVLVSVKENGNEQMKYLRKMFNDYMSINFMLTPIILQSDAFEGFEIAHQKYDKLVEISKYIYFLPHTYFFDLSEMEDMLTNQQDTVEPKFEIFSEALIARDMNEVKSLLKEFVETPEVFRNSVDKLHSIILKYIFLYNYYLRDIMKESKAKDNAEIYSEMSRIYDVEDFYYWFIDLIQKTFDELSTMEENPKKTVIALIENIIMESIDEENLSLDYIAEKVYLSPKYISRVFKEETGVKITQYITDSKLNKAANLLLETNMSLKELIKLVGFSSVNYFIKKFKEKFYVTPTQYRRNSIGS